MAGPQGLQQPMDMIRINLDENVYIKCKGGREIIGKLHAYDEHCNMVLSEAKETITAVETDPQTKEESTKITTRNSGTVFVRGDSLIMLSHAPET